MNYFVYLVQQMVISDNQLLGSLYFKKQIYVLYSINYCKAFILAISEF